MKNSLEFNAASPEIRDEVVNVAEFIAKGVEIPQGKKYLITINGDPHVFDNLIISRSQIIRKVGFENETKLMVFQIIDDSDLIMLDGNDKIDLSQPGFEKFIVKESFVFNYYVDDDTETSDTKTLTANQILKRATYKPSDYYLVELLEGGGQKSYKDNPDEEIVLTHKPEKRFISIYRGDMPVS